VRPGADPAMSPALAVTTNRRLKRDLRIPPSFITVAQWPGIANLSNAMHSEKAKEAGQLFELYQPYWTPGVQRYVIFLGRYYCDSTIGLPTLRIVGQELIQITKAGIEWQEARFKRNEERPPSVPSQFMA